MHRYTGKYTQPTNTNRHTDTHLQTSVNIYQQYCYHILIVWSHHLNMTAALPIALSLSCINEKIKHVWNITCQHVMCGNWAKLQSRPIPTICLAQCILCSLGYYYPKQQAMKGQKWQYIIVESCCVKMVTLEILVMSSLKYYFRYRHGIPCNPFLNYLLSTDA